MTDTETLFKQFVLESPLARNSCITMDSAVIPQWREVFIAGYQAAMENVGDVILSEPVKPAPKKKK